MKEPVVKCVDHLTVRVSPPEPLFDTFTQNLLLTQAWPLNTNPFYTSGGVHLGNLNLQIMQVQHEPQPARLYGIAFDLLPFDESLPALQERGVPHTPPQPFYIVDEQGWQVTAWTNVYLGGLLGSGALANLFFALASRAPHETWERGAMPTSFNRRFGRPFVFDRVYRTGMTYGVSYNPAWRAANIASQATQSGLELLKVYEVTIGVRDLNAARKSWKALLNPYPERAPGVWVMPDGLHIHLVETNRVSLLRMIWQVTSVNRAAQFLYKRDMLGAEKDGMLTIEDSKIGGLDIRLVQ
jgi:hypothetical protein